MKKFFFSLSLLLAFATVAGESTVDAAAQVYGVLPVYSTDSEVIVAVPWVAMANSETNSISVADLIRTAELTAGDWIRVWDQANGQFKVWNLVEDKTTGVKTWEAGTVVSASGVAQSGNSADTCLQRGEALVLYRQTPGTFYVCGQFKSTGAASVQCALATKSGDKVVPAYTLIAPPKTTASSVNDITWTNVGSNDKLVVGGAKQLVWDKASGAAFSSWGVWVWDKSSKQWEWSTSDATIPAGTGVWYVSTDAEGSAPVATW